MKWLKLLSFCALMLPFSSCERHSVSELAVIEGAPAGAAANTPKKEAEAAPSDSEAAPKYFPDQK